MATKAEADYGRLEQQLDKAHKSRWLWLWMLLFGWCPLADFSLVGEKHLGEKHSLVKAIIKVARGVLWANVVLLGRAYLAALPAVLKNVFDVEMSWVTAVPGHEVIFPTASGPPMTKGSSVAWALYLIPLAWSWLAAQLTGRSIRFIYWKLVDMCRPDIERADDEYSRT